MEISLASMFKAYTEMDRPPIIELLNIDGKPVGALYMDTLKHNQFVISDTNNSEKYYLYIDGVGIYFSFYKKIG